MKRLLSIAFLGFVGCVTTAEKGPMPTKFSLEIKEMFGTACVQVGIPYNLCDCFLEEFAFVFKSEQEFDAFNRRTFSGQGTAQDNQIIKTVGDKCVAKLSAKEPVEQKEEASVPPPKKEKKPIDKSKLQ